MSYHGYLKTIRELNKCPECEKQLPRPKFVPSLPPGTYMQLFYCNYCSYVKKKYCRLSKDKLHWKEVKNQKKEKDEKAY